MRLDKRLKVAGDMAVVFFVFLIEFGIVLGLMTGFFLRFVFGPDYFVAGIVLGGLGGALLITVVTHGEEGRRSEGGGEFWEGKGEFSRAGRLRSQERLMTAIRTALLENPGISHTALLSALDGHGDGKELKEIALRRLLDENEVECQRKGRARRYYASHIELS